MYKIIYLFILTIFIAVEGHLYFPILDAPNNVPNKTEPKIQYRLPETAIPITYNIRLTPNLDETSKKNFTFEGIVTITIEVKKESDKLILHSKELDILKVILKESYTVRVDSNFKLEPETDFLIITKKNGIISPGNYSLEIEYMGILNNKMRGFYRSSYVIDGKTVWLATTHFEPVGARLAFPCFDEPKYKAEFKLEIVHDENYNAISNTKGTRVSISEKIITSFDVTPKMSTYLIAFVISNFKYIHNKADNFRVYARPNALTHGQLALEAGEALLNELDKFTGIPFSKSIKKMDQAAIPDFVAGAMENWGLVLYQEKSLLYDDKTLTTSEKQNIVETIAHEFAHQWFGDLVSPDWWKYIWLNEGFANFFQSYITEKVKDYEDWRSVDQSVVKSIQTTAFDFDSGPTTHPINQDVESPAEISAIFDSISYQKGGAVIRMMQHFLTEKVFQAGLQNYLKTYQMKVATSDNLFDAIQEAATKLNSTLKVKDIMNSWVEHKGYPVVTVTRNANKNVTFKQERFFNYNASKTEINDKHIWLIPINYVTQAKGDFKDTKPVNWLVEASKDIEIDVDDKDWLIVNKQQTGFYRVNYDEKNWELIISYLNSANRDKIHLLNRAQLINDALAFTKQEKLNLLTLLHLTAHLKNETDYIPWYPGFKTFSWLNAKLANTEHYPIFKEYILETTKKLVSHVGLEEKKNDKHLDKLNRITAINWMCTLGDTTCTTEMNTKLVKFLNGTTKALTPDLKQAILCHGLRKASFEDWEKVLKKYESSNDSVEKGHFITALGCSTNRTILETYLNKSVVDNSPLKDAIAVIKSVRDNSDVGIEVALDFVVKRFISILIKVQKVYEITNVFTGIGEKITTVSLLEKLEATKNTDIPRKVTIKGIESAKKNIEWLKNNDKDLISWIKELTAKPTNGVGIFSASLSLISSLVIVIIITVK